MSISRRDFLKYAAAVGATAKVGGSLFAADAVAAVAEAADPNAPMTLPAKVGALPRRILGRTGQAVTILGLGCAYFSHGPKDEAGKPTVTPIEDVHKTLDAAFEGGIRYFDTSPDYKVSEERLGPWMTDRKNRDQIFLVTKLNSPDGKACEEEFAKSLKLLQTDHVDLVLQHCVGVLAGQKGKMSDTEMMLGAGGSVEFMRKMKKQGKARFIGFSVHHDKAAFKPGLALLDGTDDWDVVMPFVNYVSRADINAEQVIVERCRKAKIGVTAMKTLGGQGQLADDYDRAFRYTLSVPGVACALVGCHDADQVKRAVRAAKEFRPLTGVEMAETIKLGKQMFEEKSKKLSLLQMHHPADLGAVRLA